MRTKLFYAENNFVAFFAKLYINEKNQWHFNTNHLRTLFLFFIKIGIPRAISNNQKITGKQQYHNWNNQFWIWPEHSTIKIYQENSTQKNWDLNKAGKTGENPNRYEQPAQNVCKHNDMANEHGRKTAKRHVVSQQVIHSSHVSQKINPFVA